jgi:DNA-binding response OmpR family regulator
MTTDTPIPLNLDFAGYRIRGGIGMQPLTATEREVLQILAQAPGQAVSREQILREVWGDESLVESANVDNVISRLRRKLETVGASPRMIQTVHGVGYCWTPPPAVYRDINSSQNRQEGVALVKGILEPAAV